MALDLSTDRITPVDGVFNIDKPFGITTMDVVRRIKRASGQKRVGHGGTLDPIATGVVHICLGQATRMMEYVIDFTKVYEVQIELGIETDTYDSSGQVIRVGDASLIKANDVRSALQQFIGCIEQVPPMYSALKVNGKRLYELARSGVEIARPPRKVKVISIDLSGWDHPVALVKITCGRGFYVRSLAHDLGEALGCGAHVRRLIRLKSGSFILENAIRLHDAEQVFANNTWDKFIHKSDEMVKHFRSVTVDNRTEKMIRHGQSFPDGAPIKSLDVDEKCRAYTSDGRFLGIIIFNSSIGRWKTSKVFNLI